VCATPSETSIIAVGRTLGGGRFKVRGELSRGGTASIFAADDARRGHAVALKMLAGKGPEELYRIKREFRTVRPLVHQNLVRLFDLVADGPDVFFTMELLQGWHVDEYLRENGRVLWKRLGPTLHQIAAALDVIHGKGLIHRDLKPSNIMVVRGGRVVLLDFGFAVSRNYSELQTFEFAGTPLFMAPEQMDGVATDASDWYSVGTILRRLHRDCCNQEEAPDGFLNLVRSLTDPDSKSRGGLQAVRGFLASTGPGDVVAHSTGQQGHAFVGRREPLRQLHGSLLRVAQTRLPSIALVHGSSGIGKTELINRFLAEARVAGREPTVLSGRCHLRESIHFRTFDGIIDELTRYIASLPPEMRRSVLPDDAGSITRVFPVMGRIEEFAAPDAPEVEPPEARRLGILSLRELIAKLATQRTLVLWIDDCQWADSESLDLLRVLFAAPNAPAVLLLLSYRTDRFDTEQIRSDRNVEFVNEIPTLCQEVGILGDEIPLEPLSETQVHLLFRQLTGTDGVPDDVLATCEGNPLLIHQLAVEMKSRTFVPGASWLVDRVRRLAPGDQQLLRFISVAGHAMRLTTLAKLQAEAVSRVEDLCAGQWLRPKAQSGEECYDIYHDRIRDAIVGTLSDVDRSQLHEALATIMRNDPGHTSLELATHYFEAGRPDQAAHFALQSATEAKHAQAFEQAADRLRWAFEMRGRDLKDWWIREQRGEALAASGRFGEAADEYGEAAAAAQRYPEAIESAVRLKVKSATMHLRAGGSDSARNAYREAAELLGAAPHEDHHLLRGKLARLPWIVRMPRFVDRGAAPDEVVERFQLLRELAVSMTTVDARMYWRTGYVWLREAIRTGDPTLAGDAASTEATMHSALGGVFRHSSQRLLDFAYRCITPEHLYEYQKLLCANAGVCINEGRWRDCAAYSEQANEMMIKHFPDLPWGRTVIHQFWFVGLSMLGELGELHDRAARVLVQAERVGDIRLIGTYQFGYATFGHLATGHAASIAAATARLAPTGVEGGLKGVPRGAIPFIAMGSVLAQMFEGRFDIARELLDAYFAWTRRDLAAQGYAAFVMRYLRGLTALALASGGASGDALDDVRLQIKMLKKQRLAASKAGAAYLLGELRLLKNEVAATRKFFRAAMLGFAQADMPMFSLAIERRLASLTDHGRERAFRRIDEQIRAYGVAEVDGVLRLHARAVY